VRRYQLYIRKEDAWEWIGTIDAATHADAFQLALQCLGPGDNDRPIRIEEDTERTYRKPVRRRRKR
jgi:hypothetical protein